MSKQMQIDDDIYEENPWGDDEPILGARLSDDFLPSPDALKNAEVRVIKSNPELNLPLLSEDMESLYIRSSNIGITPEELAIGVLHDFLTGKLVRCDVRN